MIDLCCFFVLFFCGLVANRIKGAFFILFWKIVEGGLYLSHEETPLFETLIMIEMYLQRMVGASSNSIVFQDNITVDTSVMLLVVTYAVAASIGFGTETVLFLEILVTYAVMCLR